MKILKPRLLKELKNKKHVINAVNKNNPSNYSEIYNEFMTKVDAYEHTIYEYNALIDKLTVVRTTLQNQTKKLMAIKEPTRAAIILELGKDSQQYKDYNHSSEYTIQKARALKAKSKPK